MVRETFGQAVDDALSQLEYAGVPRDAVAVIRARLRRDKRVVAAALDLCTAEVCGRDFWSCYGVLDAQVRALKARQGAEV